jgi:hypothetical protein
MIILPTLRGSFASGGLDPNASNYINYITNGVIDEVSVSPMQRLAISTFFKTGKRQGWLSSIKRIYLPIWGSAGANSLCLVSLEAGSFSGTVAQGNYGYVQSNGATGFFNTFYAVANVSASSAHVFSLCHVAPTIFTGGQFGVQQGANRLQVGASGTTTATSLHGTSTLSLTITAAQLRGIFSQSTTGASFRRFTRTGATVSHSATSTASNVHPIFGNFQAMRTGSVYTNAGLGAYGVGNGLSVTNQDLFTFALRNLWQTCTGFTLP